MHKEVNYDNVVVIDMVVTARYEKDLLCWFGTIFDFYMDCCKL